MTAARTSVRGQDPAYRPPPADGMSRPPCYHARFVPVVEPIAHGRPTCLRCRRPAAACWCRYIVPHPSRTRLVFLQHPREARMPVGTCRMAHLSLPNSELHIGLDAASQPQLAATLDRPGTAVLFPGPGAIDARALTTPVDTLVVVDGTWSTARKLVERCPLLSRLPRVALSPARPGNYRIRREPAAHCLATIEAVAEVLEVLEHAPGRYASLLLPFERMVDFQIQQADSHRATYFRARRRGGVSRDATAPLRTASDRLVLVHGEANWWPPSAGVAGSAELVQWLAVAPASGRSFSALVAPRRPLGPRVPDHLGEHPAAILGGESPAQFIARWRAFCPPEGVVVAWGRYAIELLATEGWVAPAFIDLKQLALHVRGRASGGAEQLAISLGETLPPAARGARRLHAMRAIYCALIAEEAGD